MPRRFTASLRPHHISLAQRRVATLAGAVLLGLAAIAFARCGEVAQSLFTRMVAQWPLAPFVVTPLTFAGVVWMTRRCWPAARGS